VRDIFVQSSNVGAALIGLESGAERQRAFLNALGLTGQARTEAGPVAPPLLPGRWDRIETVTISYGHGLAVAPIQFAAAAAALINGGRRVMPTFLSAARPPGEAVIKPETSLAMRELMRFNVTSAAGTGRRADVPGYEVGGKTGTAEMPGEKGYQKRAVIASFLGAFPMQAPRYVTLVSLYEPKPIAETNGQITAGVNAAPVTARIVQRIAPVLGVLPRRLEVAEPGAGAQPGGK
jgi:cell division protein FtsI (penicillin-binding protein 3)